MTKRNVFYRSNDIDGIRRLAADQVPQLVREADVISSTTNGAQVQMHGSTKATRANILAGISLKQNDHVVMIRSELTGNWIIVGAYQATTSSTTDTTGVAAGSDAPLAPSKLSVTGGQGLLIATWQVTATSTGIFQMEVADNTSESNAQFLIIAGSTLPYLTSANKYFRVRSIDDHWNFSSWTTWVLGTPSTPTTVPIAGGGTGQTDFQSAFDALAPSSPGVGDMIVFDGSHWVRQIASVDGYVIMAADGQLRLNTSSTKRLIDSNAIVPVNNQYIIYGSLEVANGFILDIEGEVYVI